MNIFYPEKLEKNKALFAAVIIASWTAYGLFFGMQSFLRATSAGKAASLSSSIITWLICGYAWALLTVPMLRFVRRYSLDRLGWSTFLLVHIPAAPVFGSIALALYVALATALLPGRGRTMVDFYRGIFIDEIQSEILVYVAIVGISTVYQKIFHPTAERTDRIPRPLSAEPTAAVSPPTNSNSRTGYVTNVQANGHTNGYLRRISIKNNGRIAFVDADDILWISSYGNYLKVHTANARYMHRETMTAIEQKLDPREFVRIRRSAIIRVDEVKELRPIQNGEYEVVLKNEAVFTSTRCYRKNVEALIQR